MIKCAYNWMDNEVIIKGFYFCLKPVQFIHAIKI